jgi:hypothetical protein
MDVMSFSGLSNSPELELETLETQNKSRKKTHKESLAKAQVEMMPRPMEISMEDRETQGKTPCPKGIELLNKLEAMATRIPNSVPLATPIHRLSAFSADPHSWVTSLEQGPDDFEDDWMILNSMLKTIFGWGKTEMQENAKQMLNCGKYGLDSFIQFFKYFVLQQGLEGAMIEPKIDGLLGEIDLQ